MCTGMLLLRCTPGTGRDSWQRAAAKREFHGESPSGTWEQSRASARHNTKPAESVHIPLQAAELDIPTLCDRRAASPLCPRKMGTRTKLGKRSGEATSQGEQGQFGCVRGDSTGEQTQVVADALERRQVTNSEFTGDMCHSLIKSPAE